MLVASDITLCVVQNGVSSAILNNVSIGFEAARMHALIGPSGCGKSVLIQSLLRQNAAQGTVSLDGRPITSVADIAGRIGFVPQFSIACEKLTVRQNLTFSKKLFGGKPSVESIASLVGLEAHLDKTCQLLSGGQKRRLALAIELMSEPSYLICDEVTTGLDPISELEILQLLRSLTAKGITVICVIHNLNQLSGFDCIHVLKDGQLCFEGSYGQMMDFYSLEDPCMVYRYIRPGDHLLHRDGLAAGGAANATATGQPVTSGAAGSTASHPESVRPRRSQLAALLERRARLFLQDRGQLALTLILTFGFPFLVVIFAWNGLPQIEGLSLAPSYDVMARITAQIDSSKEMMQVGSLVSGIIIFQVILLALMGANNGAREIANEYNLFRKERLLGLRPVDYLLSKVIYLLCISALQGLWMSAFVKYICGIPGDFWLQTLMLVLVNFSMSCVSLCISAYAGSSEKASLISTYLVGFQLPLSGIVLALPEALIWLLRPFIATYWSWSGYVVTIKDTRFYDAITFALGQYPLAYWLSVLVLLLHVVLAVGLAFVRLRRL